MANNKAFKVKNGLELEAYSKAISDTAVDVFVYDTSKDSDGGAWRKRTQGTSWYNETLNTATRGSRKEFPAVAVIVAESDTVTIYDGDDPDMPMWMVFNALGSQRPLISTASGLPTSVSAKNGIIGLGLGAGSINDGQAGIGVINFVSEVVTKTNTTAGNGSGVLGPLVDRNTPKPSNGVFPYGSAIVNNTVNDVAMTVLPNAPIDAATGLPVPTIAVATDGGVSVIKDDGTVVDTTSTDVFNGVSFTKSQYGADLYAVNTTFADDPQWFPNVGGLSDGFTFTKNFYARTPSYEKLSSDILSRQSGNVFALIAEHTFAVGMGTSGGINLDPALNLVQHSTTLDDSGLVAFINDDHNTGWQNGDIKLATLSDTDDTDVTGSELVTNGDFATGDLTGWTDKSSGTGTATVNGSDQLELYRPDGSNVGWAQQAIATVSGSTYLLTVNEITDGGAIFIGSTDGGSDIYGASAASGINIVMFTATSTTTYIGLRGSGNGTTSVYDNVSVRLAEEDRSVNGNGLQVFGTVPKSAVATGADLVAYGGFTNDNYLQQPYNSDLNFGTGDFCVMGWINVGSDTSHQGLLNRDTLGATGAGLLVEFRTGTNSILFQPRDGTTVANSFTTTGSIGLNRWIFFVGVRDNDGKVQRLYLDGELNQAVSVSALNLDSTTAITRIGHEVNQGRNFSGKMALWRISATAPSAEQIAKIYEDEKYLFQAGAQATLYGSSDAVTALAYDDSTELLHVGTSAGRSVFQGLRRVDNTTTAVSAAISASNNLVGEQ